MVAWLKPSHNAESATPLTGSQLNGQDGFNESAISKIACEIPSTHLERSSSPTHRYISNNYSISLTS
eukprot:4008724-Amphidinium_carterae.1